MKALEFLPTNIVFPITSSNTVLVVILSVLLLKESLSFLQAGGITLAVVTIMLFYSDATKSFKKEHIKAGLLISLIAMLFSAAVSFTNKIAAVSVEKELFIAVSYFTAALLSAVFSKIKKRKLIDKNSLILGIKIGAVNFAGFFLLLSALEKGPLSIIAPIISLYVLVTAMLGCMIYKEELSRKRIFLVMLSIVAVVVIGI